MLVAEYDYELDIKTQREEAELIGEARGEARGEAKGEAKGIFKGTVSLIVNKMLKGQDVDRISDDLLMDREKVATYINIIEKYAPTYDLEAICQELRGYYII